MNPTNYSIWLVVENECGEDSTMEVVTVLPNLVNAQFVASDLIGCSPLQLDVTNNSSGATHMIYDFGGLAQIEAFDASYTFINAGIYTVIQYADDGCGFDTTSTTVTVLQSPSLDASLQSTGACLGVQLDFESVAANASSVTWDMGDGTILNMNSGSYTYSSAGNKTITVTANANNGCQISETLDYEVYDLPVAQFTLPVSFVCSGENVCMNNTSTGASDFEWNFDDGNTDNTDAPCHAFINTNALPVSLDISLDATTAFGCANSTQQTLVVSPVPTGTFILSETESCDIPAFVDASSDDVNMNWQWLVNGSTLGSQNQMQFQFNTVGDYMIHLDVVNEFGCENSSEQNFTVHPSPVLGMSANPLSGCYDLNVVFTNTTTDAATYAWDFGDGNISSIPDPAHVFDEPGIFDVTLTATSSNGCVTMQLFPNYIEVFDHPVAEFFYDPRNNQHLFPGGSIHQ